MDCSGYWAVANDEGCVLLIMGEYCKSSAASLTYGDDEDNANMTRSALLLLDQVVSKQAGVQLDLTRVYGTGHSAGQPDGADPDPQQRGLLLRRRGLHLLPQHGVHRRQHDAQLSAGRSGRHQTSLTWPLTWTLLGSD